MQSKNPCPVCGGHSWAEPEVWVDGVRVDPWAELARMAAELESARARESAALEEVARLGEAQAEADDLRRRVTRGFLNAALEEVVRLEEVARRLDREVWLLRAPHRRGLI